MVSAVKKMPFKQRIVFYSLLLSSGIMLSLYLVMDPYVIRTTKRKLVTIRNDRTELIKEFLHTSERAIQLLFGQTDVINAMSALIPQPQAPNSPLNPLMTTSEDLLKKRMLFNQLLQSYKQKLDYKCCVLFDSHGAVIFTDAPAYDKVSLQDKQFRASELGMSLQQSLMTLTTDIAEFTYDPYLKTSALFVTVPLFKNKQLLCVAAVCLNEQHLYDITDNYIGLGATGDLNIAKPIPAGILYLNKIRSEFFAPFKKFLPLTYSIHTRELSPMQRATLGYNGVGILLDALDVWSVASWGYVPRMNIGIVAKISYHEVLKPIVLYKKLLLFFLLATLLLLLLYIRMNLALRSYWHAGWRWITSSAMDQQRLHTALQIVWLISCIGLSFACYYVYTLRKDTAAKKQEEIRAQIVDVQQHIEQTLHTVELVTKTLSYNMQLGHHNEEELITRLKKNMSENPMIAGISVAYAPYKYDKNKKLFGRYVTRTTTGEQVHNLDTLYDYTADVLTNAPYKIFYLHHLSEKKLLWINPSIESISKKFVAACANPFYTQDDKEILGVVTVFLDMDFINKFVETINLSAQGTACLLTKQGTFIYHPSLDYKHDEKTLIELAQRSASPELVTLWKRKNIAYQFHNFYDVAAQEEKNTYFVHIVHTQWLLGILFRAKLLNPSIPLLRHSYTTLLFALIFFIIATLMLCFGIYKPQRRTSLARFFSLSLPLLICFLALIYISYTYQSPESKDIYRITTPFELQQFIAEKKEIAAIVHEPEPITIVTGLEIDSLQKVPDTGNLKVSGFIWQYYDELKHKGIEPGLFFSHASEAATFTKAYATKMGTTTIIGWKFVVEFPYKWNESLYPLDINVIAISLEHPDFSKNILLVPDLNAYQRAYPKIPATLKL